LTNAQNGNKEKKESRKENGQKDNQKESFQKKEISLFLAENRLDVSRAVFFIRLLKSLKLWYSQNTNENQY
jgi:hypothetical protein